MSKISEILDRIVDEGCHCDAMVGFVCGIHRLRTELEEVLPNDTEMDVDKAFKFLHGHEVSWTKGREIPE